MHRKETWRLPDVAVDLNPVHLEDQMSRCAAIFAGRKNLRLSPPVSLTPCFSADS